MTVVEEIIQWCEENTIVMEDSSRVDHNVIYLDDMQKHFDEWKKKEKEQLHDAFIEGYRGEI